MASLQLSTINQWQDGDVYAFFNKLIDFCCESDGHSLNCLSNCTNQEFFQMFPQFANSETVESCRMICNYFVKQLHHSLAGAESDVDKQDLSAKVLKVYHELLGVRCKELYKCLIFKSISTQIATLDSYDWKISAVLCNDQLTNVNEVLFKFDLKVVRPKAVDSSERLITLEFTKDELKSFLAQLQDARKALEEKLLDVQN